MFRNEKKLDPKHSWASDMDTLCNQGQYNFSDSSDGLANILKPIYHRGFFFNLAELISILIKQFKISNIFLSIENSEKTLFV